MIASAATAAEMMTGSGAKSSSAVISTRPGILRQVIVSSASTDSITVNLYDNATSASGTKLIPTWIIISPTTNNLQTLYVDSERYGTGLYADITSSGTFSYVVIYKNDN